MITCFTNAFTAKFRYFFLFLGYRIADTLEIKFVNLLFWRV